MKLVPLALPLVLCALNGCGTGRAANSAARATSQVYNAAVTTTQAALETAGGVVSLVPTTEEPQDGPEMARQRMLDQAGTEHFRNPRMAATRNQLTTQRISFPQVQERARVERFGEMKAQFRGGPGIPQRGSVRDGLGEPVVVMVNGKPVIVRTPTGDQVIRRVAHPVLSRINPAFGAGAAAGGAGAGDGQ